MISLVLFMILATLLAAIYFKKRYMVWCSVAVLLSFFCMILSNALYMRTLTNVNFGVGMDKMIIDFLDNLFYLTVSDMRIVSLVGEIILFMVVVVIPGKLLSGKLSNKKAIYYVASGFFILIYVYMCLPDVMFGFYVDINSIDPNVVKQTQSTLELWRITKKVIITYFAVLPHIVCFFKYRSTILLFKKKEVLSIALFVLIVELMVLLSLVSNIINNFIEGSYEIFYKSSLPEVYRTESYGIFLIVLLMFFLVIFVIRTKLSRKYYTRFNVKKIYGVNRLDKSLKMVLHTYKNIFFLIRQLSEEDMNDEVLNEHSKQQLSKISNLSKNALYGITKQIKMFSEIENETETFKIDDCIELAMGNLDAKEQNYINVSYNTDKKIIKSDIYYLSDVIYNILKNAIEAVSRVEEPKVDISIWYEDGWFLVEISDNGHGIEQHRLKEIFKPLVSYKNGRDNWGIGLYYSYKIINTLSGYLYVQSEVDKYTKFKMYIPQNIKEKSRK